MIKIPKYFDKLFKVLKMKYNDEIINKLLPFLLKGVLVLWKLAM